MTKRLVTTKRIGVLMGGLSAERDVSIRSGLAIYQALQEMGYNSVLIDVGRDVVSLLKKEKVRFAFLALHGGMGENGAIQGLLEVMGIPYTGSGILASAIAMDKEVSKKLFRYHGLPVADFITIHKGVRNGFDKSSIGFGTPWVIKPATEGSSIGVSIVKDEVGLKPSIDKAFTYSDRVLIERFIEGREVHIGILGNRVLGGVEVRPSLEFYNYEAKYTSGLTEYIIPPELDRDVYERAKETAMDAYKGIGCSGACRVDLIIDKQGVPYLLEVNTLPGMTTTSLLPKIAHSAGLGFNDLIEEMIRLAIK
ncbi:MAG: D-alanine--D-alanine ligase [Thermodesulfovibrionia bacterium]